MARAYTSARGVPGPSGDESFSADEAALVRRGDEADVGEFGAAVDEDDVGGFDVAVGEGLAVEVEESVSELAADFDAVVERHGAVAVELFVAAEGAGV